MLLDRNSAWTYGDMFRLIRLLGKYPVEAINDPKLNAIFLAWDAVVPGWAERFWKECKKCKPVHDPGFSDFGRWREIAERPADAAAATTFFERLMDEQVARLEELLEVHEEIAGDDPAELADCASFDGSAEGERLRRSLSAQRRELRQTLELLMKMQKSENHGHAGGDDGTMKDDKCAETETPALKVATSNEDHCEPGATATPGPRKPNRDKSRSMAALEMVRSERLDEQGFEKFFADPPAALVVLKGLRKLAERKVLLGRAPVQASRSATGEAGTKNAEIEANGDETQTAEPQEDKAHDPIVGGEKRSQVREEDSLGPRMKHGSNTDEYRAAVRVIHGAATGSKSSQCTIRALPLLSSLKGIRLLLVLPGPVCANLGFANGSRILYNKYSTSALAWIMSTEFFSTACRLPPFIRPAVETSRMTSRLAQWTSWNLLALWLVTAGDHAAESVLDRLTIEPSSTVLDGGRASAQLIATGHYGDAIRS